MKTKWGLLLGLIITACLLVFSFYDVNIREFMSCFWVYNPVWAILCVALFAVNIVIRALMWRITTARMGRSSFSTLFGGVTVGYMANNLLPFRGGELVRTYYLAKRGDYPYAGVFSTVVIERALDVTVLGILLVGGLVLGVSGLDAARAREALLIILAVLVLFSAFIWCLIRMQKRAGDGKLTLWIKPHLSHFLGPLKAISSPGMCLNLFLLSLAAWLCNWLSMAVLLHGISFRGSLLVVSLLLLLFVNLGMLIPSSPGALGVMQIAFYASLYPFGVPKVSALALSFIFQISIYIFTLVVGLPFFMHAHLKLGMVREKGGMSKV